MYARVAVSVVLGLALGWGWGHSPESVKPSAAAPTRVRSPMSSAPAATPRPEMRRLMASLQPPRLHYASPVESVLAQNPATPLTDRCENALPAASGVAPAVVKKFCALAGGFDVLQRLRYAGVDVEASDHEAMCSDARQHLASAQDIVRAVDDCGEVSIEVLAWTDEAWLAGCIDTSAWAETYRGFREHRQQFDTGGARCMTTAKVWKQMGLGGDRVSSEETLDRVMNSQDWTTLSLCMPPILPKLRQDPAALLGIEDPEMASIARACINGDSEPFPFPGVF